MTLAVDRALNLEYIKISRSDREKVLFFFLFFLFFYIFCVCVGGGDLGNSMFRGI